MCYTIMEDTDMLTAAAWVLVGGISQKISNEYSPFAGMHTVCECPLSVLEVANKLVPCSLLSTLAKVRWDMRQ